MAHGFQGASTLLSRLDWSSAEPHLTNRASPLELARIKLFAFSVFTLPVVAVAALWLLWGYFFNDEKESAEARAVVLSVAYPFLWLWGR